MPLRTLKDLKNIKGQRVLVRVDFNVPVKKGQVLEQYRIIQSVPTIRYLLKGGAAIILVSHLGRPKKFAADLSLKPIVPILRRLLGATVNFVSFQDGASFANAVGKFVAKPGTITLLENIRFVPGEVESDKKVISRLASLADYFVSDCFAVAHRSSASITGVAKHLPAFAGFLMEREVNTLATVMENPKRPLVLLLGGVKVETKIPVIKNFLGKAQTILIGGGIANTYWKATGHRLGKSLVDKEYTSVIKRLCQNKKIILPQDVVVGSADGKHTRVETINQNKKLNLKANEAILDIGPASVRRFAHYLRAANTIIWNGAVGHFEVRPYHFGTYALAGFIAARAKGPSFGVVGGGETIEVIRHLKLEKDIDFISTGGGAMLEFLAGKILPGIKAVSK